MWVCLPLLAGALGIAAAVVFYVKTADAMNFRSVDNDLSGWSFYVFISGSCLVALCGIVLMVMSSPRRPQHVTP
ncbi:hypothetical protein ACOMHN_005937 [Nucella lapillus]